MSAVAPETAQAPAAKPPTTLRVRVTERQLAMITNPARFLFLGAGTKTGKTTALEIRASRAILRGDPVAWSGSLLAKTKKTYRRLKQLFGDQKPPDPRTPAGSGAVVFNDSAGSIFNSRGDPLFTSFTGEHPEAIYGDGYKLFIIDEASRQPEAVYNAALTTISAADGQIVCAFNLDHGARNWAIKRLLAVTKMTEEERRDQSKAYMMFPTMKEPWVSPEFYEEARTSGMSPTLFDALYNAVIPTDDVAIFSNLDVLWTGAAPTTPTRGHTYIMGVDLGRKRNWTVATVFDVTTSRFVASIRLYQIGWTVQYERISTLYRFWNCCKAWVDQSGLGDPVCEELEQKGMAVEGYVFSEPSRKLLVEGFSAACDGKLFTAPDNDDFAPHKKELASFEIIVSKGVQGKITYSKPQGEDFHDDAAFSMMLAWYGFKEGNFGAPRIERLREDPREAAADVEAFARGTRLATFSKRDLDGF